MGSKTIKIIHKGENKLIRRHTRMTINHTVSNLGVCILYIFIIPGTVKQITIIRLIVGEQKRGKVHRLAHCKTSTEKGVDVLQQLHNNGVIIKGYFERLGRGYLTKKIQ